MGQSFDIDVFLSVIRPTGHSVHRLGLIRELKNGIVVVRGRDMIAERLFSMLNPNSPLIQSWSLRSFLLLALFFISPVLAFADAGLDDYNVAVGLYKQESWKKAETQFRDFLKTHSKHDKAPLARLYLGLALVNLDDFETARTELVRFVKENPKNSNIVQARYRIAECSYLLNDLPLARNQFESYLKDFSGDTFHDHALPYLADVQLRLNDPTAALATFQKAIDRFPKGPLVEDAKFGLARSLEMLKRDDEAAERFRELASQTEGSRAADAQFHLGAIAFERKKLDEAISAYSDLITRFPQSRFVPAAHLNLGYAYYQKDKFTDAHQSFEAAAQDKSQRSTASYWQGLCFKALKQYADAAKALKVAAEVTKSGAADHGPSLESIQFQQAICERHLEHYNEANSLFTSVLDQWPKGEFGDDSLHALAEIAIDSGELANADKLMNRFASDYPTSSLTIHTELLRGRLELAKVASLLKSDSSKSHANDHYELAANRFEAVLRDSKIARTKNQARYFLAFTRQLQGQHETALQLIAPLVEQVRTDGVGSDFGDALVLQADSCQVEKRNDEAIKAVSSYMKLFPHGRQVARALSIQAVTAMRDRNHAVAEEALNRLEQDFSEHPMRLATLQQLAQLADSNQDWATAVRVYSSLINILKDPDDIPYAFRGLGWAQYKQKQGAVAAQTFL
ncbi:MAG: tetratricopeptide repeat protein, partial [Planctomycetes bacterium]|nr:tetratricopeptide repeat protein [Planctomycetota bacterium]